MAYGTISAGNCCAGTAGAGSSIVIVQLLPAMLQCWDRWGAGTSLVYSYVITSADNF
jgi:hypothetical protein